MKKKADRMDLLNLKTIIEKLKKSEFRLLFDVFWSFSQIFYKEMKNSKIIHK